MKPYYQDASCTIYHGEPGPKKGYKQSPEHIEKRKRFGAEHANFRGDNIERRSGWTRAERKFDIPETCELCGEARRLDRHHVDGNTANNEAANIAFLCRRCHMIADGRLNLVKKQSKENQPNAVAARWR